MTIQILKSVKTYIGKYDVSGDLNAVALNYGRDTKESTTFGQDTKIFKAGLKNVTAQHEGLWNDSGDIDTALFDEMGTANVPMTICPVEGLEGELAYTFKSDIVEYSPNAGVGDLLKFTVKADAQGSLVRGVILKNGTVSADGNGTAISGSAVLSSQSLYATLHVLGATASTSADIKIQSAATSAFSGPTDQIVFARQLSSGSQVLASAGPITDTWYRIVSDVTGSNPSYSVVVVIGVK